MIKEHFIEILLGLCVIGFCFLSLKLGGDKDSLEKEYGIKIGQLEQSLEHSDSIYAACMERGKKKFEFDKKMREQREEAEEGKKHQDFLASIRRTAERIPCKFKTEKWVTKIETTAQVPDGSFKALAAAGKGKGPDPGLSRAQNRRLLKALKMIPYPPECSDKKIEEVIKE